MKPFARADRVSGQIQKILSDVLKKKIRDPRLTSVTITGIKMSPDLKLAYVYFTTFGSSSQKGAEALKGFSSSSGFLKRHLAKELGLRYMPELKFFYDESFDYGAHIDSILKSIESNHSS